MLNDLSVWKRSRITPRKRSRLYYAAIYCSNLPGLEPEERDSDDDAANVLKRCGIEGASEMLKQSARVRRKESEESGALKRPV